MRRPWLPAATIALALAAINCAARMTASSHVERGLDFSGYSVYQWGRADALPTGDERLDKDPFFHDHMQGAVEKQLAMRGLTLARSAPADLLIHYHANISERIDVNAVDTAHGYCQAGACPTNVVRYDAGTLILDVLDARTNRLIWRGWAQTDMRDVVGDRARLAQVIDEAAARILRRFPRAPYAAAQPAAR